MTAPTARRSSRNWNWGTGRRSRSSLLPVDMTPQLAKHNKLFLACFAKTGRRAKGCELRSMPDEWEPGLDMWDQVLLRGIQTWDRRAGVRPVATRPGTAVAFFVADGKDPITTAQVAAKTSVLGRRHPDSAPRRRTWRPTGKRRRAAWTTPARRPGFVGTEETAWTTSTLVIPSGPPGAAHPGLAVRRENLRVAMVVCRPRPRISRVIAVRSLFFIRIVHVERMHLPACPVLQPDNRVETKFRSGWRGDTYDSPHDPP